MGLLQGFEIVFQFSNLLLCFIGVFVGTLVGVLPGIGPTATIALLLPVTFSLQPAGALIMLAGIYYGAMFGGSTTSILVNVPGEAASVITCIDGYQMARHGRAGPALGIAAFGSFIAATVGIMMLQFMAFPMAKVALRFGPPEYFSLFCFSLILVTVIGGSVSNSIMMALLGLFLSFIGIDQFSGARRFTFGMVQLTGGIGFVTLAMGVFGIGEILVNIETLEEKVEILRMSYKGLFPSLKDWKDSIGAILRGAVVGFFSGVLPGCGAVVATIVSYGVEKRISKYPDKFGTGVIQGVAGPESANNAAAQGCFIPLLVLGIPTGAVTAMLLGALTIHGIAPGPDLMGKYPEVFWGVVASMYVGNGMLLILNLPLIPMWVKILRVPYRVLFPLILLFIIIGSYSINNSIFDLRLTVGFGVLGYILRKLKFETMPLIVTFILGGRLEEALRQSLIMSRGSFNIFMSRPTSLVFLVLGVVVILSSVFRMFKR